MKNLLMLSIATVLSALPALAQNAPGTPGTPGYATPTNQTTPSTAILPDTAQNTGFPRVSGDVMEGMVQHKVPPVVPSGVTVRGTVSVHAIIDADGKVVSATALSGPTQLRNSAVNCVRQWTFRPYQKDGQPTAVDTTLDVAFQ